MGTTLGQRADGHGATPAGGTVLEVGQPAAARDGGRDPHAVVLDLDRQVRTHLDTHHHVVRAGVPDDVVEDAVAVVREALANVARHARAHDVVVRVEVGSNLVVEVQDDGVGIPADVTRHSGLANLENRAARRDGTVVVRALPEGGTHLRWSVPLS